MEMTVQIYSSRLIALYKIFVDFLHIFTNDFIFQNESDKTRFYCLMHCKNVQQYE